MADDLNRCAAWRDAAVADGWSIEPTYKSEDVSRAATLKREGYVAMVFTRAYDSEYVEASVSVWGPDGLAIDAMFPYSWSDVTNGLRRCIYCGATDVDTERVNFAGRACATCLPAIRAETEKPGWCN